MKVPIYLLCFPFLCKLAVDAACSFQHGTYGEYHTGHCLCGPENQTVSREESKYCCVQNQDTCKVQASTKLCPNATVLNDHLSCHGSCDGIQCPSNPKYCMSSGPYGGTGCDGQHQCKELCSGSIEKFPYYNNSTKSSCKCGGGFCSYCGKRDGAKFHNFQCSVNRPSRLVYNILYKDEIEYTCLNRMDITEERIREIGIYHNKIPNRKKLFEIFQSNNTMNSITQRHIKCGNNKWTWEKGFGSIYCKKEKNDKREIPIKPFDIYSAFDFLQDRGLQVNHIPENIIYPLGMSLHYLIIQ